MCVDYYGESDKLSQLNDYGKEVVKQACKDYIAFIDSIPKPPPPE